MTFRELDVVVIESLLVETRHVDGTEGVVRQPMIGDVGTIVHELSATDFIVECVDESGYTVWLADFHAEELARSPGTGAQR